MTEENLGNMTVREKTCVWVGIIAQVMLCILKLCGILDFSWAIVLFPLESYLLTCVIVFFMALILDCTCDENPLLDDNDEKND